MKSLSAGLLLLAGTLVYLDVAAQRSAARELPGEPAYKVMILGFDGLDPEFLEYLLDQGKLPNFQRLRREGAYAPCQSFKPTKSVVLWTSIATGKRMEKHGIIDWMLLSEDGRERVMASGNARRTEAIWNIATSAGRSVRVLNWWASWPAEPVKGEIVSNHFPRSLDTELEEVTYPESLARELEGLDLPDRADSNAALARAGMPVYSRERAETGFRPSNNFRQRFQSSAGVFNEDWIIERSFAHLTETRGQADLVASLFRTADVFTHYMWRFIERRVAERVFRELREKGRPLTPETVRRMEEAYARVLEPVYLHEDRRLGRLMAMADDDTVVLVVSDHGFQFRNYGFNHYDHGEGGVKAPPGVLFLWGKPVRPGAEIQRPSVLDVTPTALYLLGIPVGEDMDGRVLTEAFRPGLLAARPVGWVKSHDTGRRGSAPRRSPVDDAVMEELRTLGYLP